MPDVEIPPAPQGARPPVGFPQLPPRIAAIALEEAERAGVTVADLVGPAHHRVIVHARRAAWARLRRLDEKRPSYPRIGMWFNRDHATVHYGVQKFEADPTPPPPPKIWPPVPSKGQPHWSLDAELYLLGFPTHLPPEAYDAFPNRTETAVETKWRKLRRRARAA